MKKSLNLRLYQFANFAAAVLALIVLAGISILTFLYRSDVSMDRIEAVSFHRNRIVVYFCLAVCVLFLMLLRRLLRSISGKQLFTVLSIIYIFAGVLLICGLGIERRADANAVAWAAEQFLWGDYSELKMGGYLYKYPFQLGLVTYERMLAVLSRNPKILFCANFLFTLLINFTTWKISENLFLEHPSTQKLTILLSFLFLPQFFFIAFAYGTIPGWAMLVQAFYFQLRFLKERKKRYVLLVAVFGALSCLLRSNNLIGVIAMAIVFLLDGIREKKKSCILVLLALMLAVSGSSKALNLYYEAASGEPVPQGAPKLLWVAMGLRDGSQRMGGWWDAFNEVTYTKVDYDAEAAKEIARESLDASISRFKASPGYTARFFGKKITSTWCDPLFQSLWSGPLQDCGQTFDDDRLSELYSGESLTFKITQLACQTLLIFMYAMAVLFLVQSLKTKAYDRYLLVYIFFIGGFLFHVIWETKSQYVYSYVFALIPCVANAFDIMCAQITERKWTFRVKKNILVNK